MLNCTKTYRYSTTGQRTVKQNSINDIEYYLDGLILDADGKVKSYQTSEGYAVPYEDNGTTTVSYYYNVTDWLGTTRGVLDENGNTLNAADHYPYGLRMSGRAFISDVEGNRYQFTGHEHDGETGYDYHGARYYNRELGRYMSTDPLMAEFTAWSPYNYVMGNPISLIDPDGKAPTDDYKLSKEGFLTLIRKTDDKFDRVYATNSSYEVIEDNYVTINDKSILPQFSGTGIDKNGSKYKSAVTGKEGAHSLFKLFKFAADNTNVEWGVTRAKVGDSEEFRLSTSLKGAGLVSPLNFYSEEQIISDIHSHPQVNGHSKEDALFSMGVDPSYDRARGDWGNKINAGEKSHPKYVYFPNSTAVWKIGYYENQFSFIRNINSDYKRLFFGGVLYNPNSK
jgi:RHS repeat-associated protein